MSKSRNYVVVLWGDNFAETAVTIFVAGLREAGFHVKLVGLTLKHVSGAHGLALLPDLTLDQALPLADSTICVVIPCRAAGIKRLENDPRLREFCCQADANGAKFVTGPLSEADLADLDLFPVAADNLIIYPDDEDLVPFVRDFAGSLLVLV